MKQRLIIILLCISIGSIFSCERTYSCNCSDYDHEPIYQIETSVEYTDKQTAIQNCKSIQRECRNSYPNSHCYLLEE